MARHLNALSFAALTVLVLAAAAAAQGSPAVGVYGGEGGNIQGQVGGVASGALPFTGARSRSSSWLASLCCSPASCWSAGAAPNRKHGLNVASRDAGAETRQPASEAPLRWR